MPKEWSDKDERQYEHIKESSLSEGRSTKRAKQIAAATVNKRRTNEGRTKSAKTGSSTKGGSAKAGAKRKSPGRRSTRR